MPEGRPGNTIHVGSGPPKATSNCADMLLSHERGRERKEREREKERMKYIPGSGIFSL